MKYLLKTEKNENGNMVFSKQRKGKWYIYFVKNEKGEVATVDKKWILRNKNNIVNLGVDANENIYYKSRKEDEKNSDGLTLTIKFDNDMGSDLTDFQKVKYTIFDFAFNTDLENLSSGVEMYACKALQEIIVEELEKEAKEHEYNLIIHALTIRDEKDCCNPNYVDRYYEFVSNLNLRNNREYKCVDGVCYVDEEQFVALYKKFKHEVLDYSKEFWHFMKTYARRYTVESFFVELLKNKAERQFVKLVIYLPEP